MSEGSRTLDRIPPFLREDDCKAFYGHHSNIRLLTYEECRSILNAPVYGEKP